ncbi:MAG: pyridoxamine 5'-phosphate oxidase family protein [Chitinophagaceae bacterium]|jgi:general stress protein 26|nr:pyridoxamine 5'-phosphate oxidase family protein [Chitinophagaceae bacterium]
MGNTENLSFKEAIAKIKELVSAADICMFTTALTQLPLSTRPMSTQQTDSEGNLWFFSEKESDKNEHIQVDNRVQLFYTNKSSSEFLSIYGTAEIFTDKQKIEELWTPIVKTWFQQGKDDPSITIIKVVPQDAYYWDTKHNKLVSLIKIITSVAIGKTMDDGVEGKLSV